MDAAKLKEILDLHKKWLLGEANGAQADLCGENLRGADLRWANLYGAILCGADLYGAILRGADLHGANIDYASWPLHCGSLYVKVDRRIAAQLAYHFCRLDCDDKDFLTARNAILDFSNTFHRVNECGRLKKIEAPETEKCAL